MEFESEIYFNCPYCGERVSVLVEDLHGGQSYIEDCEVCCRPIQITYEIRDETVVNFDISRID